ncbi:type I-C CRISPR-associated protein Cas7/Csd2 [Myxococcus sp. SDU36]|uniref:type I-C CRISPR-associated protein Cas7/Csd2 n=1 Tax=Myxococcus sp. SDU36 TaxID=2831967 RepID=UPI0025437257|nr:type I-C CRISPR-associated protein Cas7/Csd2 [Myxococcus sp. SDU36]WIG94598.1 type I-C CRISPR-associated protein Cas7/Csd2 [Myxococcus sp. SDU36]
MGAITNRYEFVLLFDVIKGNPNGDPDAGNLPRLDPETNQGLVSDVSLKRKVRNYVELEKGSETGFAIYMAEKAILNEQHAKAYTAENLKPAAKKLPKAKEKADALTRWMCANFFDVRCFGAVMTTEVNCGQVRGPVQLGFASSIDPIVPLEVSITRMAVTNEKDAEKERTMGRKHLVPYGLYRAHGFISAKLAERSGFSAEDLELLWRSLTNMFEHDRSAARGEMATRKLLVFKHDSALGNAPAHRLFDLVHVRRRNDDAPARQYADYVVDIARDKLPEGVALEEKL